MINLLIKFSLLVWPFGHPLDVWVGDSFPIPLLDILASAILLSSLPQLFKSRKSPQKDPLFKPIFIFLIISAISLLLKIPEVGLPGVLVPSFYLLRLVVYLSMYFVFRINNPKKYLGYLKLSMFLYVAFGLAQYLFSPNMSFIKFIGFDDHYYRLIGTFLDPNFTGAVLSSITIFFLASGYLRFGLLLMIPLALTFSRASYLSLFFPVIAYSLIKRKFVLLALPLFLGGTLFIAPKPYGEGVNLLRTFSIYSRIGSSQQGISYFIQKPLFGWGYNTLITDTGRVGIDNSFIYLLATTGVIGLGAFIWLLYSVLKRKALPVRLAIFSLLVHALFNNTLFYPWILAYLVILMAIDES